MKLPSGAGIIRTYAVKVLSRSISIDVKKLCHLFVSVSPGHSSWCLSRHNSADIWTA